MLRSKKDVDRHVRDILNKVRTEDERKVRGYNIARMYYNVGEYESARRYLSEFLSVRPKANDAHRLLGQIFESLNLKEKAVQAYKTAYELGEGQRDLVLKICELYCDVPCDASVRLYWADEGDRLFPHHENVIRLREAIISSSSTSSREELEKLYFDEIKANPLRVKLYTSLLQLYKDWKGKEKEAYKYGFQIEARKAFPDSLEWYQALCDSSEVYRNIADVDDDVEFHRNYLSVLERLVYLTLASSSSTALLSQCTHMDASTLLHKFDQALMTSLKIVGEDQVFGKLMVGQLYMHMASILLHSSKKESLLQTNTSAGALLFHACRFRPSEGGHPSKSQTSQEQFWYKLACYRLSQAYHVLHHMAKTEGEKSQFLETIKQKISNTEAQANIFTTIFGSSYSNTMESSFFMNDDKFYTAVLAYPEPEQVKKWDSVVGSMYCSSLRDMVWLCMQQAPSNLKEPQPYYSFSLFEGLQFSSNKINTGAAETLSHLDLLAFLVATVFCQKAASKDAHGPPPASLPTVVTSVLNTSEQAEWWNAAYTLFTNRAHHRLNKLRMILQRGLEVIRAIGNHGIDLILMAHLAQCFTKWAQIAKSDGSCRSEVEALEERAKHYWDCVLSLCQKVGRNTNTIVLRNRLFVVQSESLSPSEIEKVQEEGKYFLAMRLVHAGKKQEAIQALGNLKSPEASYERAMLYKEQAQGLLTESCAESLTPDMRSQYTSLLRQARDTLYLTLDRLRMPDIDRCHPLNTKLSQQLEDVEKRLSHITLNPDVSVQREDDTESLSDESQSRLDLTNGHVNNGSQALHMFSTPVRDNRNGSRITRQEARPSPERLDAQVRALTEVQEHSLRNLEEQNSALRSQNEELRKLCATISKESNHSASMYREMLEQNKTCSQEALNSILTAIHNLQTHVLSIAEDLSEVVKAMKSGQKLLEKPDAKLEEQVPVELPAAAAVVPPGLNNYYVNYYDQQVPYYRPSPGFLRFPPFSPPSTLAEQSYSITTSVGQAPGVSTIAQASAAIVTPTPSSPATIVSKDPVPSSPATAGLSLAQGISHTNFSSLSWTMATTTSNTKNISGTVETSSAPAHNYQIAMPVTCTALTPPPGSTPGETLSLSLPCSTTGLLANVPPPLYSAVTPDSSPLRGQSKVHSLSTVLSPEGLTHATGSVEATSTSPNKDGSFIENLESTQASPTKGKDTDEEEHDPCPDYKPLIPLPEKVEVRTGEENEEVLFEDRAKLFRFIDKEWRERGTGVMKILHNSSQGTARVLMRRDQTHKVCANHLVHSGIDVQPMKNNDKAWMWAAQDYADEELRLEKFCCRFKTPEIAVSFQEAFLKAKEIAKTKEASGESKVESEKEKLNAPAPATGQKSLAEMFKLPEGSWNCETCDVNNTVENIKCVACQTPKPNATKASEVQAEVQKPFAAFKFTTSETPSATTSPVSFKIITGSAVSSTPTSVATSNIGSTSGFSLNAFGSSTTSTPTTSSSAATSGLVSSTTTSFTEPSKDKFTLSGFSFFTPPTVIQEKADETQQKSQGEDKKRESVFANFTFGSMETKTTSASFSFTTVSDDKTGSVTSSPGLFSGANSAGNMASFASLASNTPEQGTTVFKITDTKAFEQKPLFGDSSAKSPSKDDGDDKDEEYEPQADFAPVVPLPDLVEVKTGEEEEVALFCERCKLFRYDTSNKEWKERGVGSLKILKNNTSGKVRILMRRDQVHKICANHFITADIKLTQMATSDKAWIWAANDFADEEMKYEKFAARFKTQELALSFKTAFESAQKSLDDAPQSSTVGVISTTIADDSEKQKATLAEMFKPKAGSWECESCLVRNDSGAIVCVACSSKKPGSEGLKDAPETVPQDKPVDPKTATLASLFKPPPGSWECSSCLIRNKAEDTVCAACGSGGSGTAVSSSSESKPAFKFGIKDTSAAGSNTQISSGGFSFSDTEKKPAFSFGISSSATTAATQPSFSFGVPSQQIKSDSTATSGKSTFSFGTQQTQSSQPFTFSVVTTPAASTFSTTTTSTTAASSTTAKDTKSSFVFGSPGKYDFTFSGVKAKSPRSRDISVCESEDGVVEEDDGDHLYFEPVIPLPEKVEVVTGEEDEIVLYCNRAKLHRLISGEWKERGLGDIKVLEHTKTGKIRLLMRREQVHKICLNHNVEKGMEFRKKDDKTFYWATVDYAENTPKSETFAIRFKTPEIAVEFYRAVDNAKVKLGGKHTEVPIVLKSTPKSEETESEKTNQGGALSASKTTFATADSTTCSSGAIGGTPKGSLFGGITGKSLFGSSLGTSGSLFGSPSTGQSFSEGLSAAAAAAKPNEPNFTVNVSSSFSLKSPPTSTPYFAGGTQVFGKGSIEIIYEKKATPEQIERARSLKLPDNFFLYEDAAPCPGCRGCTDDEDQSFKGSKEQSPVDSKTQAAPSGSLFGNLSGTQTQIGSSTSLFGGAVKSGSIFGSSTPTSQGLFGGPKLFGGAVTTTASIFGGATTTTPGSIFGTSSATGSIFGGTTTTASIFGGTTTTGSMFGGTSTSSPSIFGGATTTTSSIIGGATTTPSGIFGKATTTPSIFGGTATTTGSIFGGVSSSPSIFGGVSSSSATTPTPSLFGTTTSTSSNTFGSSTPATASSLFGGIASAKPKFFDSSSSGGLFSSSESGGFLSNKSSTSPSLFGGQPANTISFGSIAKESTPSLEASQKGAGNSDGWLKKGQSVFSRLSPKKEGDGDGNESGSAVPDLAKLKTPDEDWEVIFCRRGKLFNYDASSKQWKERGIGDFKILTDSAKGCYRLSQKLEKDSKESCNHFLTSQMKLSPMMSSETAWCWNAVDYSGSSEGKEEQIAIKFKTKDIAAEFKSKFVECQEKVGQPSENSSSSASATIVLPQSNLLPKKEEEDDDDEEEEDEEEEEEDDDDDDDDDEDDDDDDDEEEEDTENATLFLKRCTLLKKENGEWKTLGTGDLRIVYDDEFYGARIVMVADGGDTLAEHIIAIQTTMHKEGNSATWTVLNLEPSPATTVTFKAQFSSTQALEEFASAFSEGKEYAENSGIMEQPSVGGCEAPPEQLYYGQGADGQGAVHQNFGSVSYSSNLGKNSVPFSFGQIVTCDPNLTKEIAAAIEEYLPKESSDSESE